MYPPKTRTVLRTFGIILVGLLAWVAFQGRPLGRPKLSVKLLGYTNDASGAQLAIIAVTNLSASTILVYMPTIIIPAPAEPRGFAYYDSGQRVRWNSKLGRGASGSFIIAPPTNQSPWKLSFFVYNDLGTAQLIRRIITASPRQHPYEIESDLIASKE